MTFQSQLSPEVATILAKELDASVIVSKDIVVSGTTLRIRPGDIPGVKATAEIIPELGNEHYGMIQFLPSGERPANYPEDLPFLVDCSALFTTSQFGNMMAWESAGVADRVDSIISESESRGWRLASRRGGAAPFLALVEMTRGDRKRGITAGPGILVLIDNEAASVS